MDVDPHTGSFREPTTKPSVVRDRDPSTLAVAQHAELDEFNPQERGILLSLHDTILKNFKAFLRLANAAQHPRISETGAGEQTTAVVFGGGPSEHPLQLLRPKDSDLNPTIFSQAATLQRAYVQFHVWSKEFDVSSGALDRTLAVIEDLRQDVILVLLQLCDALYHGLLLLEPSPENLDPGTYLETIRLLEIAQSYVGEDDYLGVDNTSYFTIVDEISTSLEGLGDLSFCLEAPAMESFALQEIPRPPHEVGQTDIHRVYEEMMQHRFPHAIPAAITHHATANYFRFIKLQELRNGANEAEPDEKKESLLPTNTVDVDTQTVLQTTFHDSGLGTTQRHESSYAKSLISFGRRSNEPYLKLLPKFPEAGAAGENFLCSVCLRNVQFARESLWNEHVLDDLLPYVCVVHDCHTSSRPFDNRTQWLTHLKAKHEQELSLAISTLSSTCDLCAEVMTGDRMCRIAHVENHLIEIALSVVPTDEDHGPGESEGVGGTLEPEPLITKNLEKFSGPTDVLGKHDDIESVHSSTQSRNHNRRSKIAKEPKALPKRVDPKTGSESRAFPCLLQYHGCKASFASKIEWKRHLNMQHVKLSFWRCDFCPPSIDTANVEVIYYNDFNRKDLFTHHLRRMHAASGYKYDTSKEYPVTEDNIPEHQMRCNLQLRDPPDHVSCLFCHREFPGRNAWHDGLEHMSLHLEKDREINIAALWRDWKHGPKLEKYLVDEGLVVRGDDGNWVIGDGKPLRPRLPPDYDT